GGGEAELWTLLAEGRGRNDPFGETSFLYCPCSMSRVLIIIGVIGVNNYQLLFCQKWIFIIHWRI
ncbi:MAG: hypothetical protein R3Y04_06750, partial [Rikenellaceae bacterium]